MCNIQKNLCPQVQAQDSGYQDNQIHVGLIFYASLSDNICMWFPVDTHYIQMYKTKEKQLPTLYSTRKSWHAIQGHMQQARVLRSQAERAEQCGQTRSQRHREHATPNTQCLFMEFQTNVNDFSTKNHHVKSMLFKKFCITVFCQQLLLSEM